jgi:hypothetical protein
LAIHREIDPALGHTVQARLSWRMAAPPVSPGPNTDLQRAGCR